LVLSDQDDKGQGQTISQSEINTQHIVYQTDTLKYM